jgi:hypothetical protein
MRVASRVITRLTRASAPGPLTSYLNSGDTSISAVALLIALYSCSCSGSYELGA